MSSIETRSDVWIWLVVGGLALAVVLATFVVRALYTSLDKVRSGLYTSARQNVPLLSVAGVVLIATLVFAVFSMAPDVLTSSAQSSSNDLLPTTTASAEDGQAVGPGDAAIGSGGRGGSSVGGAAVEGAGPSVPVKRVNLFAADQDRRGITNDSIKICGHAPLLLGPILGTRTEDLLVYWRQLNDKGGIHGRHVDMTLEDDRYESSGGVPAAQRCREKNPFFVFGAIGSDVIAPVRVWAEQNRELYIYGFAVKKGSENLRYSYTATIGSEDISRVLADVAVNRFASKKQKIGLVWRNSSNVEPAAIAFRQRIAQAGGKIVADIPVQMSQGNYSQEIIELRQRGAEVVYIGDDALSQINMMKQAKTQNYNPNWLVFSFNLQTQTLQEDSLTPPLTGANLSPAYACGQHSGTYAPYAADVKEFEQAYAKYSPNTDLCGPAGDVAFGTWLGFKAMAGLLEVCGQNCTRNTLAGIFEAGYKVDPGGAGCPVDFSRDPHHGGYGVNLMEAYRLSNGDYGWTNLQRCVTAL